MEVEKSYLNQITTVIKNARNKVEVTVNSELVILYWNVGKIIKTQIIEGNKAEYGKSVIKKLSQELVTEYGRGYSQRNLFNMVKLYEVFDNEKILHTLCTKLTWSHFRKLIYIVPHIKTGSYDITTQIPAMNILERIGRKLYNHYLKNNNND